MTKNEQLAFIREKCIAANPEIGEITTRSHHLRLADVLLAVIANASATLTKGEIGGVVEHWNLRKDDLTEQSEECITFIYELLCN